MFTILCNKDANENYIPYQRIEDHKVSPFQNWPQLQKSAPLDQMNTLVSLEDASNPKIGNGGKKLKHCSTCYFSKNQNCFFCHCQFTPLGRRFWVTNELLVLFLLCYYHHFLNRIKNHLLQFVSHLKEVILAQLTWQFGDRRSQSLMVLSSDPEIKVSSTGDIDKATTLKHRKW